MEFERFEKRREIQAIQWKGDNLNELDEFIKDNPFNVRLFKEDFGLCWSSPNGYPESIEPYSWLIKHENGMMELLSDRLFNEQYRKVSSVIA